MFSDVKRGLWPNITAYPIINLQFGMEGFLLTPQSSSYDVILF